MSGAHRVHTFGTNEDAKLARAESAFVAFRGVDAALERRAAINALPSKDWKGRRVYGLRCCGTSGRGPHDVWVPERVLWALIDFRAYRCAFH